MLVPYVSRTLRTLAIVHLDVPNSIPQGFDPRSNPTGAPRMSHVECDPNSGSVDFVNQVRQFIDNKGFNAQTQKFEDLTKAGIIDPTKVVRSALQNAASIAGLMLTTEALVSEIPEEEKKASGMPGGPPGMGGDF